MLARIRVVGALALCSAGVAIAQAPVAPITLEAGAEFLKLPAGMYFGEILTWRVQKLTRHPTMEQR